MPEIVVSYAGGDVLRVEARGHVMLADQPVEDGGADLAPTPTELFVAGLGACIGYYAERFLRRNALPTDGLRVACSYGWADNPHRVGEIKVDVEAPGLPAAKREAFERVIEHCTLHNTLRRPPEVRIALTPSGAAVA